MNSNENKGTILIVDDSLPNLHLLSTLLGKSNYKVRAAKFANEALASTVASKPDLILLDIKLPNIDGYEVCRRLKESEATVDIPVIFMSSLNETEDKLHGFTAGAVDYISKPFNESEVLARIKVHLDICALRKTLSKSEARFKTMFMEAPLGVALINSLNGHILEVNPMFAEIAGRTMEQMIAMDWMSIAHPDELEGDLASMALLNAGKIRGFNMEKRYLRPNGEIVWLNMTISSLKHADEIQPCHLCMIENITEKIRAAEQIQEARKARAIAEQANFFKSQFLANMSHELRTPLTPILGFTEILCQAKNLTEEQRTWLTIVNQRGQDLLLMIEDILDISKIEATQMALEKNSVLLRKTSKDATPEAFKDVKVLVASRSLRVLVVDDDSVIRLLTEHLMLNAGYIVETAENGLRALAKIDEEEPFDIVLMDIRMPEMNGIEATKAIRERDQRSGRHTIVIALTAYAVEGDRSQFIEAGMDEYLTKPIETARLVNLIESLKLV